MPTSFAYGKTCIRRNNILQALDLLQIYCTLQTS